MARKLREIRDDKSIEEFCKNIHYLSSIWWEFEENLRDPSWFLLSKLCYELGINPAWLLEDEGPMLKKDISTGPGNTIDKALIKEALQAVEEYLQEVKGTLPPEKKVELVMLLCEMHMKDAPESRKINKATVIRLVKLAA